MTEQPTKDRSYYRMLTNYELLTTVKESTSLTELEVVLAERLKVTAKEQISC